MEKSSEIKKQRRTELKQLRDSIAPEARETLNRIIFQRLSSIEAFQKASCIFSYASMGSEADTAVIISDAISRKKTVALPKTYENGRMEFFSVMDVNALERGALGILEPSEARPLMKSTDADVIILPGLGFDRHLHRLGYGKGFYDRYLTRDLKALKIAIGYEVQFGMDFPTGDHDIPADVLVTDAGIRWSKDCG